MSAGAVRALEAASRRDGVKRLALYEAPVIVDDSRSTTGDQWARIGEAIAAQRLGAAVRYFLQMVGVPRLLIPLMRWSPAWPKLQTIARSLPYPRAICQALPTRPPPPATPSPSRPRP